MSRGTLDRRKGLLRLLRLIRRLETHPRVTVQQLAAEFEVCVRTMRRDLRTLEGVGARLIWDEESVSVIDGDGRKLYVGIAWDGGHLFRNREDTCRTT